LKNNGGRFSPKKITPGLTYPWHLGHLIGFSPLNNFSLYHDCGYTSPQALVSEVPTQ